MEKFLDKSGRQINIGDYIVYGHALGRCAGLRYGKVLNIKKKESEYGDSKIKIHVQGVDDWNRDVELCKNSYLEFEKRILKIEKYQLPTKILTLLEEVEEEVDPTSKDRLNKIE